MVSASWNREYRSITIPIHFTLLTPAKEKEKELRLKLSGSGKSGQERAIGTYLPFIKENDVVPDYSRAPAAGQPASLCLLVFLVSCPFNQMEKRIWAKGTRVTERAN